MFNDPQTIFAILLAVMLIPLYSLIRAKPASKPLASEMTVPSKLAVYKNIFWRPDISCQDKDGKQWANVHLLFGYTEGSIASYAEMAREIRKTFPHLKDTELYCQRVSKSSYCYGFSVLSFSAAIEKRQYPGWRESVWSDGNGGPDYSL